jgi:glutaconate CoA-transferase subunit A
MADKQISMEQAVNLIRSGSMLGLGGMTLYRRPVAFVRALIKYFRQTGTPGDLTLLAFTAGYESDLLVGAGMVSHVRSCYFGLEIFGFAPMFTNLANRGMIDIIEETETSTIIDPYSGEELIAFPAIHPDVSVIHALIADSDGNALIGDNKGVDIELSLTSKTVIVTAEEIVPELSRADLVAPCVHAVVLSPGGALPTSCHPRYPLDTEAILEYAEYVSDQDSFNNYLSLDI